MTDSDKEDLKKFISLDLENSIESVFIRVHERAKTKSGDITPEQVWKLKNLQTDIAELIFEQVMQNL